MRRCARRSGLRACSQTPAPSPPPALRQRWARRAPRALAPMAVTTAQRWSPCCRTARCRSSLSTLATRRRASSPSAARSTRPSRSPPRRPSRSAASSRTSSRRPSTTSTGASARWRSPRLCSAGRCARASSGGRAARWPLRSSPPRPRAAAAPARRAARRRTARARRRAPTASPPPLLARSTLSSSRWASRAWSGGRRCATRRPALCSTGCARCRRTPRRTGWASGGTVTSRRTTARSLATHRAPRARGARRSDRAGKGGEWTPDDRVAKKRWTPTAARQASAAAADNGSGGGLCAFALARRHTSASNARAATSPSCTVRSCDSKGAQLAPARMPQSALCPLFG
mmetsp:Transcript_16900/g.52514  ORF Transcript_16900/g.52514 Transcript_16900/m.52514 type:complete len:344 (-) Transcript_16900:181-1212(-)